MPFFTPRNQGFMKWLIPGPKERKYTKNLEHLIMLQSAHVIMRTYQKATKGKLKGHLSIKSWNNLIIKINNDSNEICTS
jgi:hypothetical protein